MESAHQRYQDLHRLGSGWVGLMGGSIRLGRGWDSPARLLRGAGTVRRFIPGWVGVRWVAGRPPWAGRRVGIVQNNF